MDTAHGISPGFPEQIVPMAFFKVNTFGICQDITNGNIFTK
jgi:hypothetical protein